MNNLLQFRRQFLVARAPVDLPHWQLAEIERDWLIYAHPDLEVHVHRQPEKTVVLLGYLFDAEDAQRTTADILASIVAKSNSFAECLQGVKPYAGRYALIYRDAATFRILHDPLGLREIYYCTSSNRVVCGSQPNLLVRFAQPALAPTRDPEIQHFRQHEMRQQKWVGDDTWYTGVKHLLPNHCLDLNTLAAARYWPNAEIRRLELGEAVQKSARFLQGMMRAAALRHPIMLAVTAGTDSRTLLAASKGVRDKVYYFVNKERDLTDDSPDIRIPREMCRELGLDFHIHAPPREVPTGFKETFLGNTFFASERILPTIHNVYFKQHSDKVNILGIGEIGRSRYGAEPRNLNAYRMAYAMDYEDSPYAIKVCGRLLPEMLPVARRYNVNLMTLLYWEQMLGNWGTVGNSESDIAVEEFDPYDSHLLYEVFLGLDDKYTTYAKNIFFKELIRAMWPEVLRWPINPPHSAKARFKWLLKQTHTYSAVKRLKYQFNYLRYVSSQAAPGKQASGI